MRVEKIIQRRALQPRQQAKTFCFRCLWQCLIMCVIGAVGTTDRGLIRPWVEIAGAAAIAAPELPNAWCYEKNAIHQFAVRQGTLCARAYRARPDGFDIVDGPHVIVHALMAPTFPIGTLPRPGWPWLSRTLRVIDDWPHPSRMQLGRLPQLGEDGRPSLDILLDRVVMARERRGNGWASTRQFSAGLTTVPLLCPRGHCTGPLHSPRIYSRNLRTAFRRSCQGRALAKNVFLL